MTKMKMVLATTLAAALAFGVAACGPQAETAPEEAAPAAVTEPAPPAPVDPAAAPATDPAATTPPADPAATTPPATPEKK